LKPCDWKELLQLIERIRKRIAQELKKPVEVISCYEAGYDRFWLHRLLEAQGVRNHVIDPASLQVDRRARRAKTDGIDVGKISPFTDGIPARRAKGLERRPCTNYHRRGRSSASPRT
jgi:hypothetical protein